MEASHDPRPATGWFGSIFELCGILSAAILFAIALLVTFDIAGRNLRFANLIWVGEVTEYMLTFATFIGAPWVLRHHGHVNIDVVVANLSPPARAMLGRLCDAFGFVICSVMFYEAVRVLVDSYKGGSLVFKNLIFPEWYLSTPPVLCFALCLIEFASRFRPRFEEAP